MITYIEQIKKGFKSSEKKSLLQNLCSLSLLQVANYLLPLITVPYLVRVLGPEYYGLISFAQAFIFYFLLISEYSFNFSATREISLCRDDCNKVSQVFWTVIWTKLLLALIGFVIMSFLLYLIPKFESEKIVYFFSYGFVIGNILFPVFFFQGMERMQYITVFHITAKLIFTVLIFVFIRNKSDFVWVPLIQSGGFLVSGVMGIWTAKKAFRLQFYPPRFKSITQVLKDGYYIFISKVSIHLYTNTNIIILGFLTTNEVIGFYAAGEKLIKMVLLLFEPLFQALFPHTNRLIQSSKNHGILFLQKIWWIVLALSVFAFLFILVFSQNLVLLILGDAFIASLPTIKILSFLILIIPAAHVLSNLTILPFKLDHYLPKIYGLGAIVNLFSVCLFVLSIPSKAQGIAFANIVTELFITIVMIIVLKKNNIWFFKKRN